MVIGSSWVMVRGIEYAETVVAVLRQISRSVSQPAVQSLIVSLVISRLDYGRAMLAGLPACQLDRLQSVLNGASRLIYSSRKFDHVTPLLHDLHWLRIPDELRFGWWFWRTAVRMDLPCSTLLMTFTRCRRSSHSDGCVRRRLRHWSSQPPRGRWSRFLCRCRSVVEQPSALFRSRLRHQRPFRFSESILRQFYFLARSRHSNTFLRFIFHLVLFCSFTCFSIVRFCLCWFYTPWFCSLMTLR